MAPYKVSRAVLHVTSLTPVSDGLLPQQTGELHHPAVLDALRRSLQDVGAAPTLTLAEPHLKLVAALAYIFREADF